MTGAVDVWTDPDFVELVREDAPLSPSRMHSQWHTRVRMPTVAATGRESSLLPSSWPSLLDAPAVALSKSLQTLIGLDWSHPVRIPARPQVHATLTSHVPTGARPGTRIRISWTLWSDNGKWQVVPFDSDEIFARIVNPAHTAASTTSAHGGHGRYAAIVSVPSGGIGHVQIGIIARRFGPAGAHPARFLFPITNSP